METYTMSPVVEHNTRKRFICALLLFAALTMLGAPASAGSGLLTGSLGRWLDTEAVPELSELLSRHPKFSGEVVRIVTLENGKPTQHISALDQAVRDHLTASLRSHQGIRLAWQEPLVSCGVRQDLSYLLGIEISSSTAANSTLSIGMIDMAESLWVSGVSLNWRGRLSSAERMAMSQNVGGGPRGTITAPMPVSDAESIAALLQQNIRCTLPDGLNGALYIEAPDSPELNRIRGQLQRQLTLTAQAAITSSRSEARWILRLAQTPLRPGTSELVVSLHERDGSSNQHLASVFVTGVRAPANEPAATEEVRIASNDLSLLSPLTLAYADADDDCGRSSGGAGPCVAVEFELRQSAYLFVLTSEDRELNVASCSRNVKQAASGPRRILLRAPAGKPDNNVDAGVYALAVHDRAAARSIARHLSKAPGACARASSRSVHSWLNGLEDILNRYPHTYTWQSAHFADRSGELIAL
jgi:hypothetical protein